MLDSKIKAAELTPGLPWINVSEALSLEKLKGKIVLLDFWTFCCSDCMHIMPYLKNLEEKYGDYLVVIGVHSAKFDNEGNEKNIKHAVARYGIEHPIVCDRGFSLWEKYFVREWPTLILIDPEGNIVERVACSQKPYGKFDEPIEILISEHTEKGTIRAGRLPQLAVHAETESGVLRYPGKVIVSPDGKNLFIADTGHHRILVCDINGTVIDTIGSGACGRNDGKFESSSFHSPQGLAFDGSNLYIADTDNHLLRLANLKDRYVETIAGNGKQRLFEHGEHIGQPRETALSSPWDLVLQQKTLFIAMAGSHQIWNYHLDDVTLEVFAGSGKESLKDGERLTSQLSQTSGLCIIDEILYFADSETSSIRQVDLKTGIVKTIVGEGLFAFGDMDGIGKVVRLQHPLGIANYDGKLLIADSYNHKIKILDPSDSSVKTLSGSRNSGNENAEDTKYGEPGGLAVHGHYAYIADTNNHALKKLDLQTGLCQQVTLKEKHSSRPALPNCTILEGKALRLKENAEINCQIKFQFADGFHMNEEMPISVHLLKSRSLHLPAKTTSKLDKEPYELTFKTTAAADAVNFAHQTVATTEPANLAPETSNDLTQIAITCYYCSDKAGSACFVKSFIYETKIELEVDGDTMVTIELIAGIT